jgi:hypothetical protein
MNEMSETEIPAKSPFAQLPSRPKSLSVNKKLKRDNSILSAQNVFCIAFCLTPHDGFVRPLRTWWPPVDNFKELPQF